MGDWGPWPPNAALKKMKFAFFKIKVLNPEEESENLNSFCSSNRIANVEKRFVEEGANSYWAFCVTYLDGHQVNIKGNKNKIDYREVLNEVDFSIFVKLRELRKELAEKKGIPPYALFTNEQLAEMIRLKVSSSSAMEKIMGIGKSRIEKYGEPFLVLLRKCNMTEDEKNSD